MELSESETGGGACVGSLSVRVICSSPGSCGVRMGGVDGPLVGDDKERREDVSYAGEESPALGTDEGSSARGS